MTGNAESRVEWVTRDEVLARWNVLFDEHPWLEGLECAGTCNDVLCCPPRDVPSYEALSRATGLLFLAGISGEVPALTRDLLHAARRPGTPDTPDTPPAS